MKIENKIGRMDCGWYAAYKTESMNYWVYRNTRWDKYGVCHVVAVSKKRAKQLIEREEIHV